MYLEAVALGKITKKYLHDSVFFPSYLNSLNYNQAPIQLTMHSASATSLFPFKTTTVVCAVNFLFIYFRFKSSTVHREKNPKKHWGKINLTTFARTHTFKKTSCNNRFCSVKHNSYPYSGS